MHKLGFIETNFSKNSTQMLYKFSAEYYITFHIIHTVELPVGFMPFCPTFMCASCTENWQEKEAKPLNYSNVYNVHGKWKAAKYVNYLGEQ